MKIGMFLAILFLTLLFFERSGFHAFGGIIANISLLTLAGMMIAQRVGPSEGAVWFFALFVVTGEGTALALSCIVPLLVIHLFTTRSVYALLGLGIVSWSIAAISVFLLGGGSDRLFHTHILPEHFFESLGIRGLLLVPGLFIGVLVVQFLERHLFSRIAFRSPS